MKNLWVLMLLFSMATAGFAQTSGRSDSLFREVPRKVIPSLHTGFSYSRHLGTSTWLTPLFSAELSERFTLTAGLTIISADRYLALPTPASAENSTEVRLKKKRDTSAWFFAEGVYAVTPRLMVSGSVMREMTGSRPYGLLPEQMTSLGMAWQASKSVTIGMQITHIQGNNSYYSPWLPLPGSFMNSY